VYQFERMKMICVTCTRPAQHAGAIAKQGLPCPPTSHPRSKRGGWYGVSWNLSIHDELQRIPRPMERARQSAPRSCSTRYSWFNNCVHVLSLVTKKSTLQAPFLFSTIAKSLGCARLMHPKWQPAAFWGSCESHEGTTTWQ
jgi:hypothetical protein